jgi:hypothetical protein
MKDNHTHSKRITWPAATLVFIYLVGIVVLAVITLVAAWPGPSGPLVQTRLGTVSTELRYFLVVACSSALGASIHAIQSFVDYVGNRMLVKSWLLFYVVRVFVAVPLALIAYVAVRASLLSTSAPVTDLNAYGIAALSGLVGMFSKPAVDKLNDVFATLFGRQTQVEKEIARIGTTLGITTLNNYQGYVCHSLQSKEGEVAPIASDGTPKLRPGEKYQLIVWFQPYPSKDSSSDEIKVEGGTDARTVEFLLSADSEKVDVRPRQIPIIVSLKDRSPDVKFDFDAPKDFGTFEVWIEITQKNRFIDIVSRRADVGEQSN